MGILVALPLPADGVTAEVHGLITLETCLPVQRWQRLIRHPPAHASTTAHTTRYNDGLVGPGGRLQRGQPRQRVVLIVTAHRRLWLQAGAHWRTARIAKDRATVICGELHAPHTGRFATRHARDRRHVLRIALSRQLLPIDNCLANLHSYCVVFRQDERTRGRKSPHLMGALKMPIIKRSHWLAPYGHNAIGEDVLRCLLAAAKSLPDPKDADVLLKLLEAYLQITRQTLLWATLHDGPRMRALCEGFIGALYSSKFINSKLSQSHRRALALLGMIRELGLAEASS